MTELLESGKMILTERPFSRLLGAELTELGNGKGEAVTAVAQGTITKLDRQ